MCTLISKNTKMNRFKNFQATIQNTELLLNKSFGREKRITLSWEISIYIPFNTWKVNIWDHFHFNFFHIPPDSHSQYFSCFSYQVHPCIYWNSGNYLVPLVKTQMALLSTSTSEIVIGLTYILNLFLHQIIHLVQNFSGAVVLANCYWQ